MEKKIKTFTLGSDPEVFLVNAENKLISGIGLIGGSKHAPLYVGDNVFLQEDNTGVEFSHKPAKTAIEFVAIVETGLNKIREAVKKYDLSIIIASSGVFEEDQLLHPDALVFGCDPDFNAWNDVMNEHADASTIGGLRSCGGHIHIGYDKELHGLNNNIVKALDLFLGVPSILMDDDEKRRSLYGRAGCYRVKKYGLEYRSLSNFWVKSKDSIEWVWNQVTKAIDFVNDDQMYLIENHEEDIKNAINKTDKDSARSLVKKFNLTVIEETCVV